MVDLWTDETRAYLVTHSTSAAARFDHMATISDQVLPRVNHVIHNEFLALERRLENLQAICENANAYLT